MVSELSKRLLRGRIGNHSSASSSPSNGALSSKLYSDSSSTLSSKSSNSETERRMPIDEPVRRSLMPTTRIENDPLGEREDCFKRRKLDELTYAASRVREDLEKGGIDFRSINTDKPRALEGFDIDMGSVRLLGAKSVSGSPFLSKTSGKRTFQSACEFEQLFSETQQVYSKSLTQNELSDWGDRSSTGSSTSESECSIAIDIPPRLEDALNKSCVQEHSPADNAVALNTVTMGSAFENSSEPRLVTLSFAPFLVIHINNAYSRMTGIEAKDVLGKPLSDVFKDKRCQFLATNGSSLHTLNNQLTSVLSRGQNKQSNCRLHISVVGSEVDNRSDEPMSITHYMVALEPVGQISLPSASSNLNLPIPSNGVGFHCEVMG